MGSWPGRIVGALSMLNMLKMIWYIVVFIREMNSLDGSFRAYI